VLAEGRPDHHADRLTERARTSTCPASRETASRVFMSPIPGSSTLVPKREKKPSAAWPQRPLAWERSCRQARVKSPWPQGFPGDHGLPSASGRAPVRPGEPVRSHSTLGSRSRLLGPRRTDRPACSGLVLRPSVRA
jgi:hypothetical protein